MRTLRCSSRWWGGGGGLPGGISSVHARIQPPPLWTEWLTNRCKNITFPQLRLRTAIIGLHRSKIAAAGKKCFLWIRELAKCQGILNWLKWQHFRNLLILITPSMKMKWKVYVSLQLSVQNAVSAQPCVGKLGISLVLLNFLGCNCGLWLKTT